MRHKVIRIIAGIIWIVVGAVVFIRDNTQWWTSALFAVVGIVFLLAALKDNKGA